jgi:SAM-dependent methyltransferase
MKLSSFLNISTLNYCNLIRLKYSIMLALCRVSNYYPATNFSERKELLFADALPDERKVLLKDFYRSFDFHFMRKKLLQSNALSDKEKALLRKVTLKTHRKDDMIHRDPVIHREDGIYLERARHYLSVGLSAIHCIENALEQSSRKDDVRSILDFPSGYGRVLRFLKARFPKADITACEIIPESLDFCEQTFSTETILSQKDFTKLSFPGKFELIWCGSLFSHIDEKAAANLLKLFYYHLSPSGLCIFTTHGQATAQRIREKHYTYGLTEESQQQVLSQFHEREYGYADYPNQQGYGISIATHERMLSIARSVGQWKEICYLERGWDNHQDVYCFTKTTSH